MAVLFHIAYREAVFVKKSLFAASVAACALALSLAGCAQAPAPTTTTTVPPAASATSEAPPAATSTSEAPPAATTSAADFYACMVSDQGGFDDKSFNETSFKGVTDAKAALGIQERHVQSATADDYSKNIQSMVEAKCDIIIGVGFNLEAAVTAAAKANPDIDFAIVDSAPSEVLPNAKGLLFNTNESSFLAGYLAAGITQTGKVATYAGMAIPSVTIFMDGYALGVQYYNQQKGTNVQVLGWDPANPDQGATVQSQSPFTDVNAGKILADNQVSQGADVLFPVAGNAGTGALQTAQNSNGKVSAIWVDTDGCISAAQFCSVMPTSVYKGMDVAVQAVITDTFNGQFSNQSYIGTLANEGTGISPFHDWDTNPLITAELRAELETIRQGIIAGTIDAGSGSV